MVYHLAETLKDPLRARNLAVSLIERSPEPNQTHLNRIYDQILSMNQLNTDKSAPPSGISLFPLNLILSIELKSLI